MIGAGAIAAEKIRLSVTVAGDPKEEELLKYDPERFDSCATINAHDPEMAKPLSGGRGAWIIHW